MTTVTIKGAGEIRIPALCPTCMKPLDPDEGSDSGHHPIFGPSWPHCPECEARESRRAWTLLGFIMGGLVLAGFTGGAIENEFGRPHDDPLSAIVVGLVFLLPAVTGWMGYRTLPPGGGLGRIRLKKGRNGLLEFRASFANPEYAEIFAAVNVPYVDSMTENG